MNFSKHLTSQMIPEWKKQYVCYEALNSIIKMECTQDILLNNHANGRYLNPMFFKRCDTELIKVNLFFSEKLTEANRTLASFGIVALDGVGSGLGGAEHLQQNTISHAHRKKSELHQLKMVVGELYLSLSFLQHFQVLNYKGFCKLTKKYDEKFSSEHGLRWRTERLDTSLLYTARNHCDQMMYKLETYMIQLEGGDKEKAMRGLEVPPRGTEPTSRQWITFWIGVTCGFTIAMLMCIAFKVVNEPHLEHVKPLLQLYKGSFLLTEFLFLMGLSLCCWRRAGVNHVLIFELDPRHHLSHHHILEIAGCLAVCWCVSILACLHPSVLPVPQLLHPLLFHSLLLFLLLNPTSTCQSRSRRWLLVVMVRFDILHLVAVSVVATLDHLQFRVLTSPFQPAGFAECWLADQLNSLSPLFLSLWDLLCFYTSQANWEDLESGNFLYRESLDVEKQNKVATCLIQCFPPWLRFAQCLRLFWDSGHTLHLLNAAKYSTVFLMVTFAGLYNAARERAELAVEVRVYLYLWALATCLSVLVTVVWDLRMDWGLLQGNGLLKEELVYPREVYYYAAMLADVLLRISWAINILLVQMKDSAAAAAVSAILAPLEVLRRCVWNLFRLENEHLKNCKRCRAVREFDFPVTPKNSPQFILLERLKTLDETSNDQHKSGFSYHKPTCLPFRYLRPRLEETDLAIGSLESEPALHES